MFFSNFEVYWKITLVEKEFPVSQEINFPVAYYHLAFKNEISNFKNFVYLI